MATAISSLHARRLEIIAPATLAEGQQSAEHGQSMAKQAQRETSTLDAIPDKLYFRIGEVASLCGVETYVLRFWQTEFPQLAPKKSGTGQRLYRKRDVEQALYIKRLLHDEGYTIAGARQVFSAEAQEQRQNPKALNLPLPPQTEGVEARRAREQFERAADRAQTRLARLRHELHELHGILSQPPGSSPSHPTIAARLQTSHKANLFEPEPC